MRLAAVPRSVRFACAVVVCAAAAAAPEPDFRSPDFHQRREALRKAVHGVIVLSGNAESFEDVQAAHSRFFQEPNFFYLTGWEEPGAKLLLDSQREILFLPSHDSDRERWTGPRHAASDPGIAELTGFDTVLPLKRFDGELGNADPVDSIIVHKQLARLRMRKSPVEIAAIQRSVDATVAAHLAAWKRAAPGVYEYQVAATMAAVYLDRGCERGAYAPMVASGPNGVFLHYETNSRRMEAGELLLMDVAAECAGYAADVTRTIPVDGHFTPRQRELYDTVLGAQKAVIEAVKPGVTIGRDTPNSLQNVALAYFNSHGHDLHGRPLGKYFIHGISHHIGLEVHDASDVSAPLEEGNVISVEPGLYIPEEQIGIRIEDMVLVTRDGAKVLTAPLPRETAEIERLMVR
jgi:Xaa-Pro aminopeptidase